MEEAAAGKARLPTVESLTDGTMRRLVTIVLVTIKKEGKGSGFI